MPSSGHSSCDIRLVTVAEELGELLKEQNIFYNQLEEFQCDSIPMTRESCTEGNSKGMPKPTLVDELPELLNNVSLHYFFIKNVNEVLILYPYL